MSRNFYAVIVIVSVVSVFAVYLMKSALNPVSDQAPDLDMRAESSGAMDSPENVMGSVRAQIEHLRELAKEDPQNVEILIALGNMYYDAGMAEPAVEYYDRVLAIEADNVDVMVDKATMLRTLKRPDDAVEILQKVIELAPKHEHAWFNMGVIYSVELNDPASAVRAWKMFLEVSPHSAHADAIRQEIERMEQKSAGG